MVVVRELTGGLYYAQPKGRSETPQGWTGVDTMRYSEGEIERGCCGWVLSWPWVGGKS